jgi:hypothetical protein
MVYALPVYNSYYTGAGNKSVTAAGQLVGGSKRAIIYDGNFNFCSNRRRLVIVKALIAGKEDFTAGIFYGAPV